MQIFFFIFILICLSGCTSSQTTIQPPNNTAQASKSNINNCSSQPKTALEKKDVKQISLNKQSVTESGQVRVGQQLGYSFDAKSDQKFNFRTPDNICVQLYTPNNQVLNGRELPEDGKYIVQVSVIQGSTSFKLEMSLESTLSSPNPESLAKQSSNTPTQPAMANPSTIPSSPNSISNSPTISKNAYISTDGKSLDAMADKIFYEKYPEFRGQRLGNENTELSFEWKQIRECDAIVDYIFYQRHPELNGRKIETSENDLRTEWFNIRNGVSGCS